MVCPALLCSSGTLSLILTRCVQLCTLTLTLTLTRCVLLCSSGELTANERSEGARLPTSRFRDFLHMSDCRWASLRESFGESCEGWGWDPCTVTKGPPRCYHCDNCDVAMQVRVKGLG
jgi:hypothetical protein